MHIRTFISTSTPSRSKRGARSFETHVKQHIDLARRVKLAVCVCRTEGCVSGWCGGGGVVAHAGEESHKKYQYGISGKEG